MQQPRPFFPYILLLVVALSMLGCGSGKSTHGQLQSISVAPATADAQNFANGQVQFTATGTYTDGSKVSPLTALWSQGSPWIKTVDGIGLDSQGVASCLGAPGTYPVGATAPVDPHMPLSQMTMTTPQVSGTAQLTCP